MGSKTRLLAISESPDGTRLAVSDFGGQAIYVLDPDNPASTKRYAMPLDSLNTSLLAPAGLAITNSGIIYFATADIGGTGTPAFHKLDTSTGSIKDLGTLQSGGVADQFIHVLLSPDGSRVYSSVEGASFWLDTSNDQIHYSAATSTGDGGVPDLSISGDGSTVTINGYLTDPFLNPEVTSAYVDWETWFPLATTGQKLNQDGSILFQPLTDGLDLIARNTGRLLYRTQIPVTVADVYDSLAVSGGQNTVAVITTAGVSLVDLSTVPISARYTQPFVDAMHSKEGILASTQTNLPAEHAVLHHSVYMTAQPKLEHTPGSKQSNLFR